MDHALQSPFNPAAKARLSDVRYDRRDRVACVLVSLHPARYLASSSADETFRVSAQITQMSSAMIRIAQNG